jgi:membrane protein DedA with SNARE-associated domain
MKFIKWFIKGNSFHLAVILLGYLAMFVIWGEDGAEDRKLAIPIWTFILLVLVIGKYRYWLKAVKEGGKTNEK